MEMWYFLFTTKLSVFSWVLQGYLDISFVPFETQIFILLWKSDETGSWDNCCIHGGSCHCKAHKTRNNLGSSRRNYHTRSNAHNSWKGDDLLPVWNSLLYHFICEPPTFSSWVLIITFSLLLITQIEELQNLSRAFCHLSSFHCHFSFLTFRFSLDCY